LIKSIMLYVSAARSMDGTWNSHLPVVITPLPQTTTNQQTTATVDWVVTVPCSLPRKERSEAHPSWSDLLGQR